jgi:hypothetical protein
MADDPSPDAAEGAAGASATTASDTATGGAPGAGAAEGVNQGATGNRPLGESPLSAQATEKDAFAERPEAFVGAAFAGGLALALIMRRLAR